MRSVLPSGLAAAALAFAPAPAAGIVELRGEIFLGSAILDVDLQEADTAAAGAIDRSI